MKFIKFSFHLYFIFIALFQLCNKNVIFLN